MQYAMNQGSCMLFETSKRPKGRSEREWGDFTEKEAKARGLKQEDAEIREKWRAFTHDYKWYAPCLSGNVTIKLLCCGGSGFLEL